MDGKNLRSILLLVVITLLASTGFAEEERDAETKNSSSANQSMQVIAVSKKSKLEIPSSGDYGKPEIKITVGAPRGHTSRQELSIYVPADRILLDTQPVLKWEVSQPVHTAVKFMLVGDETDPLIERIIVKPINAGIHFIELWKYPVNLKRGTEYQWLMQICNNTACEGTIKDITTRAVISFSS